VSDRSVEERAWGFSQAEYAAAFGLVLAPEEAAQEAAAIFDQLREDRLATVGGDDDLFGLLSLLSKDAQRRVETIRRWDAATTQGHQQRALKRSWAAEPDESD
jgi:hypothetical protein